MYDDLLQSTQAEKDVLFHNTHHRFGLWDRIKILLGKELVVHSEIETKNLVVLSGKVICTTTVSGLFPKKKLQGKRYVSQNFKENKQSKDNG